MAPVHAPFLSATAFSNADIGRIEEMSASVSDSHRAIISEGAALADTSLCLADCAIYAESYVYLPPIDMAGEEGDEGEAIVPASPFDAGVPREGSLRLLAYLSRSLKRCCSSLLLSGMPGVFWIDTTCTLSLGVDVLGFTDEFPIGTGVDGNTSEVT